LATKIDFDVYDDGGIVFLPLRGVAQCRDEDHVQFTASEARRLAVKLLVSAERAKRQEARIRAAARPSAMSIK
jgi:hypothetical protein